MSTSIGNTYCPSCGTQLARELVYCPRCGANLAPPAYTPGASPARLTGATWALSLAATLVTLGGLGMIFVFGMETMQRTVNLPAGVIGLMFGFLAVVLAVASMLVYQLSRVVTLFKVLQVEPPTAARRMPRELKEAEPAMAQLEAPREPAMSVTEQTTRTFEHAPKERQTR